MVTRKDLQIEARKQGKATYAMTRPCRRGHLGERYASCGLCVECVRENQLEHREQIKQAKHVANTKNFEPARVWSGLVRPQHKPMFECLAHVCALGSAEQIDQCEAFIRMIRSQVRNGGATK